MGKSKDKAKPVAPPKKDKNRIVLEAPTERNPVQMQVIQNRAKGTGGAGPHKNREKDVERGKAPEKHKKDPRDKEAAELESIWIVRDPDAESTIRDILYQVDTTKLAQVIIGTGLSSWKQENTTLHDDMHSAGADAKSRLARLWKGKVPAWVLSAKLASYEGNPDGRPIYPNEIQHGYGEPLAGGHDVMRRLQNNLLYEQGNTDQMRPTSPRVAASDPGVAQFLDTNMVPLGKRGGVWWLPAHNLAVSLELSGLRAWVFTIIPNMPLKKVYSPSTDPLGHGIVVTARWYSTGPTYPATVRLAERLLKSAQSRPTIEVTTAKELQWYENSFHLDLPTVLKIKLTQLALRLAAQRWGANNSLPNRFISLDEGAPRVASLYLRRCIQEGGIR